ncbi:MAG: hypothetical protein HN348_14940 [Proteobacteria bacterium]|nr:hypothetical protein [Pseudomonadota bacterium]
MFVRLMALLALLAGCSEPKGTAEEMILGGQSGEDCNDCTTGTTQWPLDEVTSFDVSGEMLLEDAAAQTNYTLTWDDSSTTPLILEVTYTDGSVTLEESCTELVVEVDLAFSTDDGAFAEDSSALLTSMGQTTKLSFVWDLNEDVSGTYTPPTDEVEGATEVILLGLGTFGTNPEGTLTGYADGESGFDIGSWQ